MATKRPVAPDPATGALKEIAVPDTIDPAILPPPGPTKGYVIAMSVAL